MRMVHYFGALAILVAPALLWTALSGLSGSPLHVGIGLFSAVFTAAVHSLLILFMIVTGRVLKEAMAARPLGPEFLAELNAFFAKKKAYPAALLAVLAIVVAAVLGFAHHGFGLHPAWHWSAAVLALVFNLWAITIEYRALRENQLLLDRAALELDRIDRERESELSAAGEDVSSAAPYDPRRAARWGLIVAVSAWFPFLYWSLIVWKGHFTRMDLHPWLELSFLASLFGLVVWRIAKRESAGSTAA
jgi:small-conductance mechanosensitive channel